VHWSRPMGGVLLLLDMSATTVSVHRFTILLWYLRTVLPTTENGSIPSLLTTGSLCRKSRRLWPYTLNTLRVMTVPTERNWSRHTVVEKWITASACTLCSSNLVSCTFYRITNRRKKEIYLPRTTTPSNKKNKEPILKLARSRLQKGKNLCWPPTLLILLQKM